MSEDTRITVMIHNKTSSSLVWDGLEKEDYHLEWGKFLDGFRPKRIEPKDSTLAFIACGAKGSGTGTEGWVKYKFLNTNLNQSFTVNFNIPYSSTNSFSISPRSPGVQCDEEGFTEHGSPTVLITVEN